MIPTWTCSLIDSAHRRASHGLEGTGSHRQPGNDEARLAWLDVRFGGYETSVGRVQIPEETHRDRRVLRPEQPPGIGSRYPSARDRPRHRWSCCSPRSGMEGGCHSTWCHASCLRQYGRGSGEARRLAGFVFGLQEGISPLQATEELEQL